MTVDQQLKFCQICLNRKFNPANGIVCSFTDAKPNFQTSCPTFSIDQAEAKQMAAREQALLESDYGGSSIERGGIKRGVLGGIGLIVLAVVWFVGGLAINRIFFYPIVLLGVGVYAVIKGLSEGNYAGRS